jgi:AraC-like DNA-binding protein
LSYNRSIAVERGDRWRLDAPQTEADAMMYLERKPHPALAPFVKMLWYSCDPSAGHSYQRVLPMGHAQVVISLARDYLTDANYSVDPLQQGPPAIFLGLYCRYQLIDAIDLAELIGITFQPGGTLPFFPHSTHLFRDRETSLEDLWGHAARSLRDNLREVATPAAKFDLLERELLERLRRVSMNRNRVVDFALTTVQASPDTATVAELTRSIGLSSRRFSELFREQVGVSPKLYCRIQRFQRAVQSLHRGEDLPWAELALACGYYDQSHFANDFRAFSGISPTSYSVARRPWSNHIALD